MLCFIDERKHPNQPQPAIAESVCGPAVLWLFGIAMAACFTGLFGGPKLVSVVISWGAAAASLAFIGAGLIRVMMRKH